MFKNLSTKALGVSGRPSEVIELALSHGFKGLELDLVEFSEQARTHGLPHSRRLIDSARLKIGAFPLAIHWDGDNDEFSADLVTATEHADLAQQIGATVATSQIEPGSRLRSFHENFELHRRRIDAVAEMLGKWNMRLGLGFTAHEGASDEYSYGFIQQADAFLMLLKMASAKNIGLDLDLWHWHWGGGKLEQVTALGAAKIAHVSLCDVDPSATAATPEEDSRRLPGAGGPIDAVAYLSTLADLGYQGGVTPRPHPSQFAGMNRDKIVKEAAAAVDQAWKAADIGPLGKKK